MPYTKSIHDNSTDANPLRNCFCIFHCTSPQDSRVIVNSMTSFGSSSIPSESYGEYPASPSLGTVESDSEALFSVDTTKKNKTAPSTSVSPEVQALLQGKKDLEAKLRKVETQIYELETSYLEESWNFGNVVRGWDNVLKYRGDSENTTTHRPARKFRQSDRIFSSSSLSSPDNLGKQGNTLLSKRARVEPKTTTSTLGESPDGQ